MAVARAVDFCRPQACAPRPPIRSWRSRGCVGKCRILRAASPALVSATVWLTSRTWVMAPAVGGCRAGAGVVYAVTWPRRRSVLERSLLYGPVRRPAVAGIIGGRRHARRR